MLTMLCKDKILLVISPLNLLEEDQVRHSKVKYLWADWTLVWHGLVHICMSFDGYYCSGSQSQDLYSRVAQGELLCYSLTLSKRMSHSWFWTFKLADVSCIRILIEVTQNEMLLSEENTIPRVRKYMWRLDYLYTTIHVDMMRHTWGIWMVWYHGDELSQMFCD